MRTARWCVRSLLGAAKEPLNEPLVVATHGDLCKGSLISREGYGVFLNGRCSGSGRAG